MSIIQEAKEYLTHDIAPTLMPTIRGRFQARLLGLYRNHAEIEVRMVNERGEVLKSFGSQIVPRGGAVIVDQFSSVWTIADNAPAVTAYFQAWCVGMNTENTEAEISLRMVDDNRKELINFGSVTRGIGGTITLNGLDITATLLPRGH